MSNRFQPAPAGSIQSTMYAGALYLGPGATTPSFPTAADLAFSAQQQAAFVKIQSLIQGLNNNEFAQNQLLQTSNATLITPASAANYGITLQRFQNQVDYVAGLAAVQAQIAANKF
jgi:hypothetical protein